MKSLILRSAASFLFTLLTVFSVFLLLRGHDEPGGGFVGGLVAAAAFALNALAFGVRAAREALRVDPRDVVAAGLLLALASGLAPMLAGGGFLAGMAADVRTPLIFDVGVYLVVLGATLVAILGLLEER